MPPLVQHRDSIGALSNSYIAPASGYSVYVFPAAAVVNSGQSGTAITVLAGHAIPTAGGKCCIMRGGAFVSGTFLTTTASTATSVTFPSSVTVVQGDLIVYLGADTATSGTTAVPNYDGSTLSIYSTPTATSPLSQSKLTSDSGGEFQYWFKDANRTLVVISGSTVKDVKQLSSFGTREFNVLDFGAKADGSTDDSAAVQKAIDAGGANCTVVFPSGSYMMTSGVTISSQKVVVRGSGRGATVITFNPAGTATLFTVDAGGSTILFLPTFKDFSLIGSGSQIKTAFNLRNCSETIIQAVSLTAWNGGSASRAIVSEGREHLRVLNCNFSGCDDVIRIKVNSNAGDTVHCDHYNFHDCIFGCNSTTTGNIVLVDSGVNLSHLSFTGAQSWNGGQYGFYFVDTTANAPFDLSFSNVRWEQSTSDTSYMFNISPFNALRGMVIDNCYCSATTHANGMKLRNCSYVHIRNFQFVGTTGRVAWDIDSTCNTVVMENPYNFPQSLPGTPGNGTETLSPSGLVYVRYPFFGIDSTGKAIHSNASSANSQNPTFVHDVLNSDSTVNAAINVAAIRHKNTTGTPAVNLAVYEVFRVPDAGGTEYRAGAVGARMTVATAGSPQSNLELWSSYGAASVMSIAHTQRVGINTGSPANALHVVATASGDAGVEVAASTTNPSSPASSAEVVMFVKAGSLYFMYNDAGTIRYLHIPLTGTGVAWSHDTTTP